LASPILREGIGSAGVLDAHGSRVFRRLRDSVCGEIKALGEFFWAGGKVGC
jgi:hypothetical protein